MRLSTAPILLGLGMPVVISSDLVGVLGLGSPLYDLFCAAIAFNWSLKHFKAMTLHSVNYSGVTEGVKLMLRKQL